MGAHYLVPRSVDADPLVVKERDHAVGCSIADATTAASTSELARFFRSGLTRVILRAVLWRSYITT